ncbi:4-hydroxyphenylpyruvate dioxygenase [Actinoplanes sp. NPDC051861]|uniref:4-hydroxyphenylpyruvate dioxygenase n=1 Tax=Actinoplanes sp. NPDC051861 TaxID=3155170 RepID=UPI00341DF880
MLYSLDHVRIYCEDLDAQIDRLVGALGFTVHGTAGGDTYSVDLRAGGIHLVLTKPVAEDDPGTAYVRAHGFGVADIALANPDVVAAYTEAVRHGARSITPPREHDGVVTAVIGGFGDVVHTLVQRPPGSLLPGFTPVAGATPGPDAGLHTLDHLAVCLEPGQLDPTVEFYERALAFDMVFTEKIEVGRQAMNSKVVQSADRTVTLTLIEPDVSRDPGQIDEFIKNHGGAGVQHIAFGTDDIVTSVSRLAARGVEFLRTPAAYYDLLVDRLTPQHHGVDELRGQNILVDEDHDGQLYQIFARSVHPRGTLFFEAIERMGARTFGSGNIKALYEAVERERMK